MWEGVLSGGLWEVPLSPAAGGEPGDNMLFLLLLRIQTVPASIFLHGYLHYFVTRLSLQGQKYLTGVAMGPNQ